MAHDLTGMRFGRFYVIERGISTPDHRGLWRCVCECGKVQLVRTDNLLSGHSQGCRSCSARNRAKQEERKRSVEEVRQAAAKQIKAQKRKKISIKGKCFNVLCTERSNNLPTIWSCSHCYCCGNRKTTLESRWKRKTPHTCSNCAYYDSGKCTNCYSDAFCDNIDERFHCRMWERQR